MAQEFRIKGDGEFTGQLKFGTLGTKLNRADLNQDSLSVFPVPFTDFRVHDAIATALPGTSAADDLGLDGGTFGTSQPTIRTSDLKAAGAVTRYARALVKLPECYEAGETVQLTISAGMVTTIADTACTLDIEAYKVGKDNSLGSDICATAAVSINSLTFADKDFAITASGLVAGDVLDVRLAIACNDAATGTTVIAAVGGVDLKCDIKG